METDKCEERNAWVREAAKDLTCARLSGSKCLKKGEYQKFIAISFRIWNEVERMGKEYD